MQRTEEELAEANAAARAFTPTLLGWVWRNRCTCIVRMSCEERDGLVRLAELGREYLDILLREEEEDDA